MTGRAPSATLPLRYLVAAAVAFNAAALGVVWLAPELGGHYYHPRLFALTHTVTLGWITMTIIGASYQLVPIVLERPLWSERLARWQFVALVLGIPGLVAHFFIPHGTGLAWAAAFVAVGAGGHLVNTVLTVRGLARWTFTARMVALGHAGLVLTALSGVLLGADRAWHILPGGQLANVHAHVHVALLGWVLPMVIGVAARVYPMFLLAREPAGAPGAMQLWGIALGVPAVVAGLVAGFLPLVAGGALGVAVAVAGHLAWVLESVRTRKRPALDWPLRMVVAGAVFVVPAALVGLALAADLVGGPRVAIAYAVLGLGGWISLTIAGMMLKIVPFLVWYRVYGPRVGKERVPTLAELSSPRAEAAAFGLLTAGLAALALSTWIGAPALIRAAAIVVAGGAVALGIALARVLAHLAQGRRARAVTPSLRMEGSS
jgi:hypothetical protein